LYSLSSSSICNAECRGRLCSKKRKGYDEEELDTIQKAISKRGKKEEPFPKKPDPGNESDDDSDDSDDDPIKVGDTVVRICYPESYPYRPSLGPPRVYIGTVTHKCTDAPWWGVRHCDGDFEELTKEEVRRHRIKDNSKMTISITNTNTTFVAVKEEGQCTRIHCNEACFNI
jgi:hypothetical protein